MAPHGPVVTRPHWLKRRLARSMPGVVQFTFDDGPHPEHTPRVLDLLAEANLRATFFVLGRNVERYPLLARRIVAEGHTIGNHSYRHRNTYSDFARAQHCIFDITGVRTNRLRPPLGRLSPGLWITALRLQSKLHYWSLDSNDWQCRSEDDAIRTGNQLADAICPSDVVLMHDNHEFAETIFSLAVISGTATRLPADLPSHR